MRRCQALIFYVLVSISPTRTFIGCLPLAPLQRYKRDFGTLRWPIQLRLQRLSVWAKELHTLKQFFMGAPTGMGRPGFSQLRPDALA